MDTIHCIYSTLILLSTGSWLVGGAEEEVPVVGYIIGAVVLVLAYSCNIINMYVIHIIGSGERV